MYIFVYVYEILSIFLDTVLNDSLTKWQFYFLSHFSALIKQVNKSIDGTADDEDEGVPTDQAIRAGLELLKVKSMKLSAYLGNYLGRLEFR